MTDQTVVHIGENSPEHVAYQLFKEIAAAELHAASRKPNRKWILDTYAECLHAVKEPHLRVRKIGPSET